MTLLKTQGKNPFVARGLCEIIADAGYELTRNYNLRYVNREAETLSGS